jgi:hypothetical protein
VLEIAQAASRDLACLIDAVMPALAAVEKSKVEESRSG